MNWAMQQMAKMALVGVRRTPGMAWVTRGTPLLAGAVRGIGDLEIGRLEVAAVVS
jgi:hypothetical protein